MGFRRFMRRYCRTYVNSQSIGTLAAPSASTVENWQYSGTGSTWCWQYVHTGPGPSPLIAVVGELLLQEALSAFSLAQLVRYEYLDVRCLTLQEVSFASNSSLLIETYPEMMYVLLCM